MTGFLFDENIPVVGGLGAFFPVIQAASLGDRMDDSRIREYG